MYYPKFIYENLPFGYFLISGYLLAYYDSLGVVMSATLFYCAGCVTLVTRSANRRQDRRKTHQKYTIPETIYEFLPYIYFAIAVLILMITQLAWLQFFASALIILALRNLMYRKVNRKNNTISRILPAPVLLFFFYLLCAFVIIINQWPAA